MRSANCDPNTGQVLRGRVCSSMHAGERLHVMRRCMQAMVRRARENIGRSECRLLLASFSPASLVGLVFPVTRPSLLSAARKGPLNMWAYWIVFCTWQNTCAVDWESPAFCLGLQRFKR